MPGILGAGGLQALVKSGLPIKGRRVVVAGSGPLLLAVARYLRQKGAVLPLIAEQAPWDRLVRFGLSLLRRPGKAIQALQLRLALRGVPYRTRCHPTACHGTTRLESVELRGPDGTQTVPCDYLACGFGLVPNLELPRLLGCSVRAGVVLVDRWQQTSLLNVFCAGEPTGIGGVEQALVEGQIAGYSATGRRDQARRLWRERRLGREFARRLEETFALDETLLHLPTEQTIICRCEDVTWGQLESYPGLALGQAADALRHGTMPGPGVWPGPGFPPRLAGGVAPAANLPGPASQPQSLVIGPGFWMAALDRPAPAWRIGTVGQNTHGWWCL